MRLLHFINAAAFCIIARDRFKLISVNSIIRYKIEELSPAIRNAMRYSNYNGDLLADQAT